MNINKPDLKMNGSLDYGNKPDKIIIHHAEMNGSVQYINDFHISKGWVMIGYNYYIRKDGSIWKGRDDNAIGANCYGQNEKSIGICFEGNFNEEKISDVQFDSGVELIKYLLVKYKNISEIGTHKKYYDTSCPGKNFPADKMIESAKL